MINLTNNSYSYLSNWYIILLHFKSSLLFRRHHKQTFKLLGAIVLFIILFSFSGKATADEKFKFLHVTCIPEASYMEIMPSQLMNIGDYDVEMYKNKYGLFHEGEGEIKCNIGKEVRIKYTSTYPRETGMCGAGTHSKLNIFIDNKLIAKEIIFNADCFDSGVSGISIQDQNYFLLMSVLMHPKTGSYIVGPKTTFRDGFIIYPEKGQFFTNKKQNFPVTMAHIKTRIQDFMPK